MGIMYTLLHKQLIVLIAILSIVTGSSSLAWCQHYGGDSDNHVIGNLTDHGETRDHGHIASDQSIIETSCSVHSHDCVHISFNQQTLTSNHTISISQRILYSCQPVPFQDTDWVISSTATNGSLRSPSRAVSPDNLQLASLQTVVLRN